MKKTFNAHTAHLVNAFSLIAIGGIGYLTTGSKNAFFPIGMGILLLPFTNGVQYQDKIIRIVVMFILTGIIAGFFNGIQDALRHRDHMVLLRLGIMIFLSLAEYTLIVKEMVQNHKKNKILKSHQKKL